MCIKQITKSTDLPKEIIGYKVMVVNNYDGSSRRTKTLRYWPEWRRVAGLCFAKNRWYQNPPVSEGRRIETDLLVANRPQTYPTGFHVFKRLKDAMARKRTHPATLRVVKVKLQQIHTLGKDNGYTDVYVGSRIMILEEVT